MNFLSLSNRAVCPPDGFRYVFPETGWLNHAWDHNTWVAQAEAHVKANNLTPDIHLTQKMEEQLCLTLPPGWCNYDDVNRPRPNVQLNWSDILAGIAAFANWFKLGRPTVPQAEADRRAMICSRCYLNVNVSGCTACHAIVQQTIGERKTRHDDHLRACGVCKCLLRAKVHFPIDSLPAAPDNQAMYPEFCWLKEGGPNYRGPALPVQD